MDRIVINVTTGEQSIVPYTEQEIADVQARVAAEAAKPNWVQFQNACFANSAVVSQLIDRYHSFMIGIQTRNLGIVQAAVTRAVADYALDPKTGIPQVTADAILAAMVANHLVMP